VNGSLAKLTRRLAGLDAAARVRWALERLPGTHVLSSSFGAQAAVALHLLCRARPGIPVVLVDTGYLFPETYRFVDELTDRLGLNLRVYRAPVSPAWQEARFGRRWEKGPEGLAAYNEFAKVEPMRRALTELGAGTWFAGLRRSQARSRATVPFVERGGARFKVHPLQRDSSLTVITEAPLLDHRWVKSSGGHRTLRAVVQTDVLWMGRQWPIELTLVRRDQMGFRMLLGREAVRERFVVDPGRSYVGGRGLRPDKRRKKKEKTKESKSPTRKASS